jgi:predicted N-formylglutamate amidohydrolase
MRRTASDDAAASAADTPVEKVSGRPDAGVLFLCDHASNALPSGYGDLGLPASEFARHIAYDIGAAAVTRHLAAAFGAPAVLTRYSRLLIDPNRGCDDPTLVMRLSDGALIPGNARVGAEEVAHRRRQYWQPYRDAVRDCLDTMLATGAVPAIVSIHSFTPCWKGKLRPWQIGILWDSDPRLPVPLMARLREAGCVVGDNEPYDGALMGDTLHEHGTRRGLAHVLVEFRQDLVGSDAGAAQWAGVLADALRPVLALPDTHIIQHHASRTERRSRGREP